MIERLKKIRNALNLTQNEFAEQLRLQRNTISLLETGKRNPSERTIDDICNIFNVSKEYLLNGIEPMFIQTPSGIMEQLKKEFDLDEFSFNLVHEYLKLDPAQREKVRDFVYCIIKKENMNCITEIPETLEEPEVKKYLSNQPVESKQEPTLEELEAEYKKSRSVSARKMDLSASNTTEDIGNAKTS